MLYPITNSDCFVVKLERLSFACGEKQAGNRQQFYLDASSLQTTQHAVVRYRAGLSLSEDAA